MYNNYVKIYNDTCQIQESTERRMGTSEKEGKGREEKRERRKTVCNDLFLKLDSKCSLYCFYIFLNIKNFIS